MPINTEHKFGRNPVVSTSWEDIVEGGAINWQDDAETISVASDDDTDDNVGGDGALTVTVEGIAAAGAILTETVTMDGTTPVVTTGEFLQVLRMFVATAGADGANAGTIIATGSDSTDEHNRISVLNSLGLGQSLFGGFIIPTDWDAPGYLHSVCVSVDGVKTATVGVFIQPPGGAKRLRLMFDAVAGNHAFLPKTGVGPFVAGTRIWAAAFVAATDAAVEVDLEIVAQPTASSPDVI